MSPVLILTVLAVFFLIILLIALGRWWGGGWWRGGGERYPGPDMPGAAKSLADEVINAAARRAADKMRQRRDVRAGGEKPPSKN